MGFRNLTRTTVSYNNKAVDDSNDHRGWAGYGLNRGGSFQNYGMDAHLLQLGAATQEPFVVIYSFSCV